jgi:hypothetical protein
MSVHYKFKSAKDYDTATFEGNFVSVANLKNIIVEQKKLGKSPDFDLKIVNALTNEGTCFFVVFSLAPRRALARARAPSGGFVARAETISTADVASAAGRGRRACRVHLGHVVDSQKHLGPGAARAGTPGRYHGQDAVRSVLACSRLRRPRTLTTSSVTAAAWARRFDLWTRRTAAPTALSTGGAGAGVGAGPGSAAAAAAISLPVRPRCV